MSARLMSFYFGRSKLVRCLAKITLTPMKLLYFVNRHNADSTKSGYNFRKLISENCSSQRMSTLKGTSINDVQY